MPNKTASGSHDSEVGALPGKAHYFDTNALRSLNRKTDMPILLTACKEGKIHICVSAVALMEFVRQRYASRAQDDEHPIESMLKSPKDFLENIYYQYRNWFQSKGVQIIDWQHSHDESAESLFKEFGVDLKNNDDNDQRDALIVATFLGAFSPSQAVMVCHESKLIRIVKAKGFAVVDSAKNLVASLREEGRSPEFDLPAWEDTLGKSQENELNKNFLKRMCSLYPELDDIYAFKPSAAGAVLLSGALEKMCASDKEIRIDILAHVQALAPVRKDDLIGLLSKKASKEIVQNNAERLSLERFLQDTGNHWLPNRENQEARQICEQAMAHRIDDLIELLGGR